MRKIRALAIKRGDVKALAAAAQGLDATGQEVVGEGAGKVVAIKEALDGQGLENPNADLQAAHAVAFFEHHGLDALGFIDDEVAEAAENLAHTGSPASDGRGRTVAELTRQSMSAPGAIWATSQRLALAAPQAAA